MFNLATVLAVVAVVVAEELDCGEEFRQSVTCSRGSVLEGFQSSPWAQIDMDKIHDGVNECFKSEDYDCKNVLPDIVGMLQMHDESIDEQIEGAKDEIRARVRPLIDAMGRDPEQVEQIVKAGMKCGVRMFPALHNGIQQCVRQVRDETKTFTLPELPKPIIEEGNSSEDSEHENMRQLVKGMILMHVSKGCPVKQFVFEAVVAEKVGDHFKAELARRVYAEKTCASVDDAQMLASCIKEAVNAGLPEELSCSNPMAEHLRFFGAIRNMCESSDACRAKQSDECTAIQQELPSLICSCGQSYIDADWDDITANITDCMAQQLPDDNQLNLPRVILRGVFKKAALEMLGEKCAQLDGAPAIYVEPEACSDAFDIESFFEKLSHGKKPRRGSPPPPPRFHGKGKGFESIGDALVGEMVDALGGKQVDKEAVEAREIKSDNQMEFELENDSGENMSESVDALVMNDTETFNGTVTEIEALSETMEMDSGTSALNGSVAEIDVMMHNESMDIENGTMSDNKTHEMEESVFLANATLDADNSTMQLEINGTLDASMINETDEANATISDSDSSTEEDSSEAGSGSQESEGGESTEGDDEDEQKSGETEDDKSTSEEGSEEKEEKTSEDEEKKKKKED